MVSGENIAYSAKKDCRINTRQSVLYMKIT